MTERKAVFLDKDGTLIPDVPYNVNPDFIVLEQGVVEGLKLLKLAGYTFIMISNQAGVARGYFKIEELEKVKQKIDLLLCKDGLEIAAYYFCPHHPDGRVPEFSIRCNCRKPEPGMILQAATNLRVSLAHSWMIGDILNDVEAGSRAGCRTILIENGNETEWIEGRNRTPSYRADNFLKAAQLILQNPLQS